MRIRLRQAVNWLLILAGTACLLLAVTFAGFGVVVSRVPEYRVQLQNWISERSGLLVEFKTLSARMRLYGPELVFDQAVVRTADGARVLATARRGSVGFDLWNSIRNARLTAGRFALESPQLGLIRTQEGRIQLLGQSLLPETEMKPFALEQLPTGRFHVRNAVVSFRDAITGRGPWSLSGVNFDVNRDSGSLELHGDASLPRTLGRQLRFSAVVQGPLQDSDHLVSTFSVDGRELDLAGWADLMPDAWPAPETGHGSIEVRGTLKGPSLLQLSADVDLAQVVAVPPTWANPLPVADRLGAEAGEHEPARVREIVHDPAETDPGAAASAARTEMLSYPRLAFGLRAQKVGDVWRAALTNLNMSRPTASWLAARIEAEWQQTADGHTKASGKADRVVLEAVWPLLAYLPESEALARLRALNASGTLDDVSLSFERDAAGAPAKYSAEAGIDDLSFAPVQQMPGAGGVSGTLRMTEAGGEFRLTSEDTHFELPRMFREPLAAQSLAGSVQWSKSGDAWTVESKDVRVTSADGRAEAQFTATIPGDGSSPVLDLTAQGTDLKVSSTHKYIPAGRLGARTLEWFDRAFLDGRVTAATLTYHGSVRDFPFRKDEGLFLVRGHVEDALFDYQPGWAPASDVTADLEFRNEGMHIHSTGANVGGLHVTEAAADIPDLKDTHLRIKAAARGDLQDGLHLLTNSPLAPALGEPFARLSGRGGLNASVDLDLPIRNLDARRIEVQARFADATVSMRDIDAPVRSLSGTLTVRNTLPAAADLQGQWLGGPLEVVIKPDGATASVLNATGTAAATQLKPFLPSAVKLSGTTQWRLATNFSAATGDAQRKTGVRIESDLRGLGVALPEPVGKSEAEARPFQVTLESDGEDAVLARSWLGDVRAIVRVARSDQGWALDRGGIRADGNAPALPSHRGLRIEGAVERFVLDDWLALRGEGDAAAGHGKPLSEYLRAANVRVGTFELGGYRWSDVRGMLQATSAGWRVDVDGPGAAGQILIPEQFSGSQPLRASLERLVLEKPEAESSGDDAGADTLDPRSIPNLQVHVGSMRVGTRAIGMFDLKASRIPEGLRVDSVAIDGNSAHAEAQGDWVVTPEGGQQSKLKMSVTSDDVAATLRALNYSDMIEGKHGELQGELQWRGGFDLERLERATGAMSVHIENGQLVAVQPGAGRVLGLFSIAALPRRLALDFKDLTEKGLAFDSIQGDFELREGNAYTSNLLLRGPAAEIGIAGRTGLASRDYDQTAVVTGNLGASLPVAGALAGGPAVGAAVLLFSQIFKEPLKGITRGYYRITGPWDNPTVERVDAAAIKVSEQQGATTGK
ncbi:MAG TPA: YhdP family protein [Steroidobacteraceae bacterium]|nr:YhdP family protein [Steroidobacteraceae bacterium]